MTDPGAQDEVLPGSDRRPPSRRTRVAVGVLVGAVGVAAVAVLAAHHPAPTPGAGRSAPGVARPAPAPAAVSLPPGRCRQDCRASSTIPADVPAAVTAAFPGAAVVSVVSHYNGREVLVDRRITAIGTDLVVRVLLTRQSPQPRLVRHRTGPTQDVRRVRVSVGANTIDVTVERPSGHSSPPGGPDLLARDPRLAVHD